MIIFLSSGRRYYATVPGSMYTAVLPKGHTYNPLYRDNDVKMEWMALEDWTYTSNFTGEK